MLYLENKVLSLHFSALQYFDAHQKQLPKIPLSIDLNPPLYYSPYSSLECCTVNHHSSSVLLRDSLSLVDFPFTNSPWLHYHTVYCCGTVFWNYSDAHPKWTNCSLPLMGTTDCTSPAWLLAVGLPLELWICPRFLNIYHKGVFSCPVTPCQWL